MVDEKRKDEATKRSSFLAFFKHREDGVEFKTLNIIIKLVGVLAALALLIFVIESIGESIFQPLFAFLSILTPFILGIVFAWLLTPVVSALVARKWKPTTASIFVTFVGVLMLSILFSGFAYVTFSSVIKFFTGGYNVSHFLNTGRDIVTVINNNINEEFSKGGMLQLVVQGGVIVGFIEKSTVINPDTMHLMNSYKLIFGSGTSIIDIVATSFSYFWKFVISAMVVGFLLPNFSNFGPSIKSIIPKGVKTEWSNFIDIVGQSFTEYMRGALMIAAIVGSVIATGISIVAFLSSTILYQEGATTILSFQSGGVLVILTIVVFGILAALTNLIPYAGPFIGGIPIIIIVALNDNTQYYWVTWAVGLVILITQSLESLFLQPFVMGRHTRLHPVAILLGLTLFGSLWGIVGMIISTPVLSVGRSVINYYNAKYDIF